MNTNHHPFLLPITTVILLTTVAQAQTRPISLTYTQHCPHLNPPTQAQAQAQAHLSQSSPILTSTYTTPATTAAVTTTTLTPLSLLPTSTPSLFQFSSLLSFRPYRHSRPRDRFLLRGGPLIPTRNRFPSFQLSGFWDSISGNMCLVGFGNDIVLNGRNYNLNVVFNAVYPNFTDVFRSFVFGSLESLDFDDGKRLFETVSIMGFNRLGYNYSLVSEKTSQDSSLSNNVGRMFRSCGQIRSLATYFELDYGNMGDCGGRNCSFLDRMFGFLPRFMSMNEIDCSHQTLVRVSFVVSNVSDIRNGIRQPLDPKRTLVAEGLWNEARTRLDFVVCRILNFTESPLNATVGDCSIRVSLELPDVLTLRNWSVVSGGIWSENGDGDPLYFDRVDIRAAGTRRAALPDMKYKYTEIERVSKFCAEKKNGFFSKKESFPDAFSQDLKFDMDVTNGKGKGAWGKAHPVFVGDRFVQNIYPYFRSPVSTPNSDTHLLNTTRVNPLNVAYRIIITPRDEFSVGGKAYSSDEKIIISAEGIYDAKVGRLCMVGCLHRETVGKEHRNTTRLDCDIFISIQFPPSKANGNLVVKGTIESKRDKTSDPLYFNRLDLSGTSLNHFQVQEVFWRMDLEITMVLISNTLACIFIGLQLFHVKKHPNVLPSISIVMLVVITLGHMIPLLLNMEAFFLSTHTKKTLLFESGGWVEVNEVLVRVITMVAFLLEFRLLQLTWSARTDDNTHKTVLQESDKKVIYYSLPLYTVAALIAWLVQLLRTPPKSTFRHYKINSKSNASLTFWGGIKSYGGFVLDAFLIPQIMFNVFSDSKESALSIPYYVGTTAVRLLPHAYDLFRAHSAAGSFDPWYIYADPGMNFYSTTWDILVSCLGLVFVVLVYLQQRFGGRWLVPKRFNNAIGYEMVSLGQ